MMHNGRIFKEGTPAEIENDAEVQELYLGDGRCLVPIANAPAAHRARDPRASTSTTARATRCRASICA
jgi:hypothetical protein